jgi:hypothetical protein
MLGGGRSTSADRIDAVFGGGSVGVRGGWRPDNDDEAGQGFYFFGRDPQQQQEHEHALFTPLVSRRAAGFPASEIYSDSRINAPPFLTELSHAVGVYEFNMKAIAGTLSPQGSVINRYG